ncbi:MAG: TVP38/TMEM64 family protein [Steroidobacteraceae bacterium]|nr:TVP38/TMEM64 family protein [Steroidobacteraceae bacterium]
MSRRLLLGLAAVGVTIVIVYLLSIRAVPIRDAVAAFLVWVDAHRGFAWTAYVLLYVLATVFLVPALPLTLAAGAIFGIGIGFALVSIGSTLGATAAFLFGRTVARDWVARRVGERAMFRALERTLAARGFWIVLLTRLSPLFPFVLLNYAYGISAVRLRDYVLASWIGMMPGTLAYVYAGSLAANVTEAIAGGAPLGAQRSMLLALGLLAPVPVTILFARRARRVLEG